MVRSDDGVPLVSGSEVDKGAKTRVAFWSRFYHIMCSFLFLSEASERDAEGMFGFDLLGAQCHAAEIGFPPLEEVSVCNSITGRGGVSVFNFMRKSPPNKALAQYRSGIRPCLSTTKLSSLPPSPHLLFHIPSLIACSCHLELVSFCRLSTRPAPSPAGPWRSPSRTSGRRLWCDATWPRAMPIGPSPRPPGMEIRVSFQCDGRVAEVSLDISKCSLSLGMDRMMESAITYNS